MRCTPEWWQNHQHSHRDVELTFPLTIRPHNAHFPRTYRVSAIYWYAVYTADANNILGANGSTVLTGQRSASTRLWMIDLHTQPTICPSSKLLLYASAVIHHENDSKLVRFYHTTLRSPAISTFIEAASRGYLDFFPQLTVQKIRRNKPHTIATSSFGHLDQSRKNYKSTRPCAKTTSPVTSRPLLDQISTQSDDFLSAESAPTNTIFTKIERTRQNFTDGTGRFSPVQSRSGSE